MGMTRANDTRRAPAAAADAAVEQVVALVDELVALIGEENKILARGMPASLTPSVTRKHELAGEFEQWVRRVTAQQLCVRVSNDALRRHLLARVKALRLAMAENVDRLRAAIDASRRRIDAVMRAIRTEIGGPAPYGPNGRIRDAQAAQSVHGGGIRA